MLFNALAAEIKAGGEKNGRLLGTDIRYMISGGGFLPEDTLRTINEADYPLYNGFGMTECGILTVEISHSVEQRIQGGVGKPFHITEYRVEPESTGELLIRGSGLYTATVRDGVIIPRDRDAWLKTGDIVHLTDDNMFFVGRSKDVIINAGGENIYPDELEKNYSGIPGVKHFCILGLKKGSYEEICYVAEAAPKYVFGFQLFDKVKMPTGNEGFIFGRRSSGSFDIRTLSGEKLSADISCKKLQLLEKRTHYLLERKAVLLS